MPKKTRVLQISMIAVAAAFVFHNAFAQNEGKATSGADAKTAAAGETMDRAKIFRAAAHAFGMILWAELGGRATRLPGIGILKTMENFASWNGLYQCSSIPLRFTTP